MVKFLCVKCGQAVETEQRDYNRDRFHAPSCSACYEAVHEECAVDGSMWPNGWHAGWCWFNGAGWMYYPPNGLLGAVWEKINNGR